MKLATNLASSGEINVSRNVWRACGWGAMGLSRKGMWTHIPVPAVSLLTSHLVPTFARTRLWPLQRFTVGRLAVVAFGGTLDDGVGGL